jgi:hypothetical protein
MPNEINAFWLGLAMAALASAQAENSVASKAPTDVKPGSITYEEVEYPYPVRYLPLTLYGRDVRMAYIDVPAARTPNGRTVMLFRLGRELDGKTRDEMPERVTS